MYAPRPSGLTVATCAVALLAVSGCTRSSEARPEPEPTASTVATTTVPTGETTVAPTDASVVTTTDPAPQSSVPSTAVPVVSVTQVPEVAEVGVPGLDSDDAFCASWSRFAGSFQVVAVTAAFGTGPPEQLASLEVAAAPTVSASYRDLLANWPPELDAEADLVADDFLGPFARRLDDARSALTEAGADESTIDAIAAAWIDGLARRDPTTPEFVIDLPDEIWATIDAAAQAFAARRVAFNADPSLVTEVRTPLTDEYLAVSCPDRGTLSGQEVGTP